MKLRIIAISGGERGHFKDLSDLVGRCFQVSFHSSVVSSTHFHCSSFAKVVRRDRSLLQPSTAERKIGSKLSSQFGVDLLSVLPSSSCRKSLSRLSKSTALGGT